MCPPHQSQDSSTAPTRRPRVLLLADGSRPAIADQVDRLQQVIGQHLDVVGVLLDQTVPLTGASIKTDDTFPEEIDFIVVLGGDGSILRAARQMGQLQIPVLGVNLGRLGFLADLRPDRLEEILPQIAAGEYNLVRHLMFQCQVIEPEGTSNSDSTILGLNEVAVLAGAPFAILEVQLYVDDELVTTYSCDGLIISTPVGSTAHNLSSGGPILRKDLQAFVISPISPHTLTNRPVVDSADRVYELVVPNPHTGTSLVVDGKVICKLSAHNRIRIKRAQAQFQLIEVHGHGYYRTLREKLGWGGQLDLG
jgi:NAD+ kinase